MWPRMYDDDEGQPLTPDHYICSYPRAGSKSALIQVALLGKQGTHTVRPIKKKMISGYSALIKLGHQWRAYSQTHNRAIADIRHKAIKDPYFYPQTFSALVKPLMRPNPRNNDYKEWN
ncbi:hypothetical protein PoB_000907700 [Plakobranchus ocellatus]|uniref:Uncharacterized protein n=1 Tax=Plakobranchus ocellatus TaxID=259542 RepID=A0AAV3YJL4_9GAST|nr:hypothetical protein PoB_000907700 [Plakobranchus ocellatus]